MSVIKAKADASHAEVECTLSASDTYVETLTIKPIPAQPWLTELVIETQYLTAKNPQEKRVKARCCVERAQMVELSNALEEFLKSIDMTRSAVNSVSQDKEQ